MRKYAPRPCLVFYNNASVRIINSYGVEFTSRPIGADFVMTARYSKSKCKERTKLHPNCVMVRKGMPHRAAKVFVPITEDEIFALLLGDKQLLNSLSPQWE